MRAFEMDFLLSLSDLGGGGYYWVSERPNRLTTAARLRGTPLRTGVRQTGAPPCGFRLFRRLPFRRPVLICLT